VKLSNEPAKPAERVIAPGDGEAEPGVQQRFEVSLRSWRQVGYASGYPRIILINRA